MKNNKLIRLLANVERREMSRFVEFVGSPFHNKREDVRRLVAYLSEVYPRFDEQTCDRQRLFRLLFPGEKHEQARLALVFTYTQRLLEQFLEWEAFQEEQAGPRTRLLKQLRRRRQYDLYEKELNKSRRQLQQTAYQTAAYHRLQYQLAAEADRYFAELGRHEHDDHIEDKQEQLDLYFLTEKLKDACEMVVRKRILKVSYSLHLLPHVLEEVRDRWNYYRQVPSVSVYFLLYRLLDGEPDISFDEIWTALQETQPYFPPEEQQLVYNYLQNYCIEQINRGQTPYLRKALEIYQTQLSKELIFVNDHLPEWHYKNIVTIGLRLRENQWVYDFIHHYRERLHPSVAENAYTFNLASFLYSTGRLGEVLELLHRVEYKDIRYYLGARSLLLRTYYDLEEYDALLSLSDAFQQFLQRNRLLADDRVQAFRNLLRFTKKAMILRERAPYLSKTRFGEEIDKLNRGIERTRVMINKDWLLQKVAEL